MTISHLGRLLLILVSWVPLYLHAQVNTAVLYNFTSPGLYSPGGLLRGADGDFYGAAYTFTGVLTGVIYKITPSGSLIELHTLDPSTTVLGGLTAGADGNFYGMDSFTQPGNTAFAVGVFQVTPSGNFTQLYWFPGPSTNNPVCGGVSVGSDGAVYGTTQAYGANNLGTVFRVSVGGSLTILHSFTGGTDGQTPCGPPVQGADGDFYGTAWVGAHNAGIIYKVTGSGAFTTLYALVNATDGYLPYQRLVQTPDGNLYGTAWNGAFFRISPSGTFTRLAIVTSGDDTTSPIVSPLTLGSDGNFYATTAQDGAFRHGTVIEISPSGSVTTLHSFGGTPDGMGPQAPSPIQGPNGTLYGATPTGGSTCCTGTIYVVGASPGLASSSYLVTPNAAPPDQGTCDGSATAAGCARTPEPIDPATGNEVLSEPDDYRSGDGRLRLTRTYNSLAARTGSSLYLGPGWQHNFSGRQLNWTNQNTPLMPQYSISKTYANPASACQQGWADVAPGQPNGASVTATYSGGMCQLSNGQSWPVYTTGTSGPGAGTVVGINSQRPTGGNLLFACQSTSCTGNPSVAVSLSPTTSGYSLTDEDDAIERYDSLGTLQSITYRGGYAQTLSYSNGFLSSVVDSFGRTLSFTYNANNQLQSVTTPSGAVQYAYDSSGRLISVTYPDTSSRQYQYTNTQYPFALTRVIDESGNAFASISYDAQGRATQSNRGAGAWANAVDYTHPTAPIVTDALGVARTYQYTSIAGRSKATAIIGSPCNTCGRSASTGYDSAGYPQSDVDWNGNQTQYVYDDTRGLVTSRTEASGTPAARTITTQWSARYRLPVSQAVYAGSSATGTPLRSVAYTYDANGNPATMTTTDMSVTPNVVRVWTMTFDAYGRVLTVKNPRTDVNSTVTYAYYTCSTGGACGQLQTTTDPMGNVTTYNAYDASGSPLTITDPNGVVTTLAYDGRERILSRTTAGESTSLSYYPTGLLKQVTLPDGSYLQYTYDAGQRLTQVHDSAGNLIQYAVDAMGNRTTASIYDPNQVLSRTASRVYSALNTLSQQIGAAGTSGVTTTFGYDDNGNQTSKRAPLNRNSGMAFDALNRPTAIVDPGNGTTNISYDAADDITVIQDPLGATTSYGKDGFGELISLSSPATGSSISTYDSAGNLKSVLDARGKGGTYTYDALNRVTQAVYGDQTIVYSYDASANGKGRLIGASDGNHSMGWQYDALGRITTKSQTVLGVTLSVQYKYVNAQMTQLTTPSGQVVAYSYANGRMVGITVNSAALLSAVAYEPFGPARNWSWSNGTSETRTHDTDGNPQQFSGTESHSYTIDNAFRVAGITNTSNAALSWTYGHDSLDRLTAAASSSTSLSWTYDANGNRLLQGGGAGPAYAASSLTWTYNNRGRVAGVSSSGGSASYVYDALGERIEKTAANGVTIYVYDELGHLIGEYGNSGQLIEETVWMEDVPVATLRPNGSGGISVYYVHADHLNAPILVTRSSDNAIMWRWDRDPFGSSAPNQNPSSLGTFAYNLRLPGQYFDGETGTSYNYFRDYDAQIGRYIQSDPAGLRGGINPYVYANGDPIDLLDPRGLYCLSPRAINAIKGAIESGFEGAEAFDAVPWGPLLGLTIGAVAGALSGYYSGDSLPDRVVAGAAVSTVTTPGDGLRGGVSGATGGAVQYVSGKVAPEPASSGAGAAVSGLITGGRLGLAINLYFSSVASVLGAVLAAGNDCPSNH
jgi:RHS repeat-associated protein